MTALDGSGVATQWIRDGSVLMPSSVDVTFDKTPACPLLDEAVEPVDEWGELLAHAPSINARITSTPRRPARIREDPFAPSGMATPDKRTCPAIRIERDITGIPLVIDPHLTPTDGAKARPLAMNAKPVPATGSMVVVKSDR